MVRLKSDAFVPEKGLEEKVYLLGQNIHDHLAASVHNVSGNRPAMLERAVFYEGLSEDSVAKLEDLARQKGVSLLLEMNRQAKKLQEQDVAQGETGKRFSFGLYFYQGDRETDGKSDRHLGEATTAQRTTPPVVEP